MRFVKRDQEFKSQQCTLNIQTMQAWSYGWWQFVACLNGKVYFNNASYSMQTRKQQGIVRDLLDALGVKYKTIYVKAGLHNIGGEVDNLKYEIRGLKDKIVNPRSNKDTNKRRVKQIKHLEREIKELKALGKLKPTLYKGKVNLDNIPKPEPMPDWKKERMKQRRLERQSQKVVNTYNQFNYSSSQADIGGPVRNFTLIKGGLSEN